MSIRLTDVYQALLRAYSAVPYNFRDGRHSFAPFHYYFEVTRRCNLRCQMCQFINFLTEVPLKRQAEGELTTEEWKEVIDQTKRFSLVTFTGGEPWLRKDFLELFERACRRSVVHCVTNGTLLREPILERIIDLAPKRFAMNGWFFAGISLDGLFEVHDKIRAQKGAFERSINAIKSIVKRREAAGKRFPMIHSTAVIQEDNLEVLPEMPAYLKDVGVDVFNLTLEYRSLDELGDVQPIEYGFDDLRLPRIDSRKLERSLLDTQKAAERAGIELRMPRAPIDEILRYYSGGISLDRFQCSVPWTTITVDYRGDVSPCYLKTLGNVRETPLKELWRGHEMRELRKGVRKGLYPACMGCCENECRDSGAGQSGFKHGTADAAGDVSGAPSKEGLAARSALPLAGD